MKSSKRKFIRTSTLALALGVLVIILSPATDATDGTNAQKRRSNGKRARVAAANARTTNARTSQTRPASSNTAAPLPSPRVEPTPTPEPKQPTADASKAKVAAIKVNELNEESLRRVLCQADATERTPLLVNFWATWCDPCREEFPDLVRIDDDYRARGLQFVTISLDDVSEINTTVPEFLAKMRAVASPAYLLNANDPEAAILGVDKDWRGELPATFLFNRAGQIVFSHKGRIKPAELRAAIDKTLNDKR